MFIFATWMVVLVALVGLVAIGICRLLAQKGYYYAEYIHIDWKEYITALVVIGALLAPLTYWIGDKYSVQEQLVYEEFYNGVETNAVENVRNCRKGTSSATSATSGRSNCTYDYVCGSYTYTETYQDLEFYTDADGNSQTRWVTKTRPATANIECPYLSQEFTYGISDSLGGNLGLAGVYGDESPTPWDASVAIPSNIPLGAPAEWVESRRRLDIEDPRPVTRLFEYDNFILAAEEEAFLPFSNDIDEFRALGMLPDHTEDILGDPLYGYNGSLANKLSFVGVEPPGGEKIWQEALNGFNGALGMTLRGDVHMVIIDSSMVTSQVTYTEALKAYWIGENFGRRAVAKNSIIVVVGTSDGQIDWAEATTGMPFGNEVMLENISGRLTRDDVTLNPETLIGNPRLTFETGADGDEEPTVVLAEDPGVLEQVVFRDFPFARASMSCEDDDDGESCIGFANLVSKLEPTTGVKLSMMAVIFFISILFWWAAAYFEWFGWITQNSSAYQRRSNRHADRLDLRRQRYRSRFH